MSSELQSPSIAAAIARAPAQRNIVLELPAELLQECFRLLDFGGCIAVSHVSRDWRAVALNDRNLWNDATAPYTSGGCGPAVLRALLARSDPLPFSFSWNKTHTLPDLAEDIAGLVCSNMHRMRVISIYEFSCNWSARLVRQPAPLLEQFDGEQTDGPADLAGLWPVIKVLRLRSLSILPMTPQKFGAVTLFSCWGVDSFIDARISLFSVFPALKSLSVRHILEEDVHCLSDPPDSLDELSLEVLYEAEIAYAPVLRACSGSRLRTLHLEHARDAAAIVEIFSESARAPWLMDVYGRDEISVELRDDAQSRVWFFRCGYGAGMSFIEPRLAACLTLLGHLAVELTLLLRLHNLVGWSRALPALRSLTLKLPVSRYLDAVPSPCTAPPVCMPQLKSLTLRLDGMSHRIQKLFEHLLPALPALIERALTVVLYVDNSEDLRACNLEPLSAITEELRVQERRSGKTTVYAAPWSGLGLHCVA